MRTHITEPPCIFKQLNLLVFYTTYALFFGNPGGLQNNHRLVFVVACPMIGGLNLSLELVGTVKLNWIFLILIHLYLRFDLRDGNLALCALKVIVPHSVWREPLIQFTL